MIKQHSQPTQPFSIASRWKSDKPNTRVYCITPILVTFVKLTIFFIELILGIHQTRVIMRSLIKNIIALISSPASNLNLRLIPTNRRSQFNNSKGIQRVARCRYYQ